MQDNNRLRGLRKKLPLSVVTAVNPGGADMRRIRRFR
jgi:hypothetical protein